MVSDLGKVLDPVADKLTQAAMLVCLLLRFPLMILPLVLLLIKETFMGISGFLVIKKNGQSIWSKMARKNCYLSAVCHDDPPCVLERNNDCCVGCVHHSLCCYDSGFPRALWEPKH